jgi:hypothetical protein
MAETRASEIFFGTPRFTSKPSKPHTKTAKKLTIVPKNGIFSLHFSKIV